jgi:short-subunit dehydrogenase
MKKKFEGRVAVVSGASSGIGFAIAKLLKSEGARVYDISKIRSDCDIFEKSFECDISDDESVKAVVDEILKKEKNIDLLFCNAGFGIGGLVENAKIESIDKIMNVNLIAHMKMTKLFLKNINEGGRIVYTGSLASIIPLPYQACYSASKAGIESFGRAVATEVKPKKIKVITFMPGDVNSGFTDARVKDVGDSEKEKHGIVEMEKAERTGQTPDSIAKKVVKVVAKKNPPLRFPVGASAGLSSKFIAFLVKILPVSFVNWLVEKIYI